MKHNVNHDVWHGGQSIKLASGGSTYFICQELDKMHQDAETGEIYTYCRKKGIRVDNPADVCSLECDVFGRCETCNGFSAVRCQECEIPRP